MIIVCQKISTKAYIAVILEKEDAYHSTGVKSMRID